MTRITLIFVFVALRFISLGQTFEVDQIEQLFRPRIRFDSKYVFDSQFRDTSSVFRQGEANAVFTFPIRTKLSADLKLDLSSLKIRDILQNSVRIKASQTLGMFRINARQAYVGFDSLPQKNIVNATAGILGVRLTRKYRIMFYSVNGSFAEQDLTANAPGLRASALVGQLHMRGLRRNFFYGVAATYSDGLFLPAAFFGGSEPIGRRFIFNYTLPVQINIQYKDDRHTLITLGVTGDGYRTGINYKSRRVNVNYTSASAYLSLRYKFSNSFVGRLEGGYVFYQNWRYTGMDSYRTNFNIAPGPYVQAGFNILFGKTIWEKVTEALFNSNP
jgi:hypothetical protein